MFLSISVEKRFKSKENVTLIDTEHRFKVFFLNSVILQLSKHVVFSLAISSNFIQFRITIITK